ncbi:unnamed protein product [Cylindrotheca closterium]|uniref:Calmodulin n=1 Tax=Cylindrotheca closterium TaxID=2856 RepID=A0AAD2CPB4_9STRA|nr:unnamed protein product [Cylindrotheca closterium]
MMECQRSWRVGIRLLLVLLPARLISASILLGGGKYETFSSIEHQQDIQGLLNLGKDYASMKKASVADIEEIYKHGEHGVGYTMVNGERLRHTLSFADLGRALSEDSLDENNRNGNNNGIRLSGKFENPMLYLYRHYFKTRKPKMQRTNEFANEIVLDLLLEIQSEPALDAMLVLNAWMYISNTLHQVTTTNCDSKIDINWNTSDRLKALDRAAALWFGLEEADTSNIKESTQTGDEDSLLEWMGFGATEEEMVDNSSMLLSQLADETSQRLGSTSVNYEIVYLFNFIRDHLVHHGEELDKCSKESSPSNHIVRANVGRLMDLMVVPLIQNLWYYNLLPMMGNSLPNQNRHFRPDSTVVRNSDFSFLKVYQAALMPRLYACDPNLADELAIDSYEAKLEMEDDEFRIDWLETFQREGLGCFRLSCEDVGCDQIQSLLQTEGGISVELDSNVDGHNVTRVGAADFSRIDRDVRMLDILLQSQAYDASIEIFTYGYHSDYSLGQLAMEEDPNASSQNSTNSYELPEHPSQAVIFRNYNRRMNITFAGNEIMSTLNRGGARATTLLDEVRATVLGNIQANVLYLSMATSFELSINQCERGDKELTLKFWDQGTAIYFGSIEGRKIFYGGGNTTDGFTSLFGLTRRMNTLFESPSESGHDDVEDMVTELLSRGAELAELQFCSTLSKLWEEEMLPVFHTTLIRAFLYYSAAWLSGDRNTQRLAEAYSKGILPLIDIVNSTSATRIQRTLGEGIDILSNIDRVEDLGSIIGSVLPEMGIRCEDVGILTKFPTLQLCFGNGPQQLALDLFGFSSVETFQNFSAVSLDVQEILRSSTLENAREIFLQGVHGLFSLASLSRFSLGAETRYDPTLNIFGFASKNNRVLGDGDRKSFDFTNGVVESLLLGKQDTSLIAEAAIVCNSWLMVVHKLHQSVNECKSASNPLQPIDEAVALWIGRSDHAMKNGWMLYEVAEHASSYLGLEESNVNQRLLVEFNALQEYARNCVDGEETFLEMRKRVNEIIRLSLIPLIQILFVNLWQDYKPTVRVYSRAIFPLVAGCNPKTHSNLADVFYSNFVYSELNETTYDDMTMFLKCSRISCSDLGFLDASNLGFRSFAAKLCERLQWKSKGNQLVGYIAENDVSELARVDLDILEVSILMKMGADEAAEDLYLYGKHSVCEDNVLCSGASKDPLSLHTIAKNVETSNMYHTNMLADYYGPSFANNVTFEAFRRSGSFSHASWAESSEVVVRNLQVMVALPAVVGLFQAAIGYCYFEATEESVHQWDSGVALYTGAIDAFSSDVESTDGFLLRSLSNSLCSQFHVCDEMGQSRSNKYLIPLLKKARKNLADSNCQIAKSILDSGIVPLAQVPLLQGVLGSIRSAAGKLTQEPRKEALIGFVYARSILPILNATNTTSSYTVENAFESTQNSKESVEETLRVYEAIGFALPALGIDCNLVYPTLCALQHNKYALPLYVKNIGIIDSDLCEIKSKLADGKQAEARNIYENGMHSFIGYGGEMNENSTSLKSLGTYTTADFFSDPLHVLFLHYETAVKGSEREVSAFGNPFVEMMFDMNLSPPVIAESILVSIVWMRVAHSLHMALETCKADTADSISVAYGLDVAAAYWIGEATMENGSDDQIGNLWYALTDDLATHYNSIHNPNDSILHLLDLTKALILTNGCETKSLMSSINKVIAEMKIPLIQGLIHGLKTNDRDLVRLYSASVIPLVSGCNPADVYFFEQTLAEGTNYDADEIIDRIYHMLPCIDLDCSKIGIHKDDASANDSRCSDVLNPSNLGDHFLKYSRLDLDLRDIDIMLQMGSKQAAEDIFFLGKHSNISLLSLAHNSELPAAAPRFALYSEYFKSLTYAHDMVLDGFAFMGNGLSQTEARVSILRFSQTILLGHTAVNTIFEAVNICDGSDSEVVEEPWNSAAALLIGSLDRSREVDSSNWYTIYDLAQNLCSEFATCSNDGMALVNTELMSALNDGRVAAQRNNCAGLKAAAEEIQALILVPVVQGLLSAAMKLSTPGRTQEDAAEAHVYSKNLLPLIQQIDQEAANFMESTFVLRKELKFESSTGASTFNIISDVLDGLGLDCSLVGALEFCEHSATPPDEPSASSHILPALGGVMIVVIIAAAAFLMYRLSRSEESVEPKDEVANASDKKSAVEEEEEPSCSGHTRSDESGNGSNSSSHFRDKSSLSIAASDVLQKAEESIIADHLAPVPLGLPSGAEQQDVPKNLEIKIIEFEDSV